MKRSRVVLVVALFLVSTALLLLLLFSSFSGTGSRSQASTLASPQSTDLSHTLIARENAQLGTKKWQYNLIKGTSMYLQAYADASSVQSGQKLTFFVSTHDEGTRYSLSVYRLGWYGGDGARLQFSTSLLPGHAQGYYDAVQHTLINCHSCFVDVKTGLVEARWRPSYSLAIPTDWTTGLYLAKFTDEYNYTTFVPFTLRGNAHARYVVVLPDTTYQAYNSWGGYSLFTSINNQLKHSVKVSFNRPYLGGQDTNQIFDASLTAIRWLEAQGYDLSYMSTVDLHEHPRLLLDHQAYISLGQDTFWTKEMRDGIEAARNQGRGLAFLGAHTGTWQMRFEPDQGGKLDRTIVSYRVTSISRNLQFDPFYSKDITRVTTQWRDPLLARPENALLGVMFSSSTSRPINFPWRISEHINSPLLASTDLALGKSYGCGLVGSAWDRIFDNGATPPELHVLANSQTQDLDNLPDRSNTTSYIAQSGALVFATGSLFWSRGLDGYRFHQDPQCQPKDEAVPEMQRLMRNVLQDLLIPHKPPQSVKSEAVPLVITPGDGSIGTRTGGMQTQYPIPIAVPTTPGSPIQKPFPPTSPESASPTPSYNQGGQKGGPEKIPTSVVQPAPTPANSIHEGRHGKRITSTDPVESSQLQPTERTHTSADEAAFRAHRPQTYWSDLLERLLAHRRKQQPYP